MPVRLTTTGKTMDHDMVVLCRPGKEGWGGGQGRGVRGARVFFFAAISPGIIAFSLYAQTQKYLGASITGFTLYLFTVYGAFYGIFIFGEHLKNFHYYGALLVFAGMFFVRKKNN